MGINSTQPTNGGLILIHGLDLIKKNHPAENDSGIGIWNFPNTQVILYKLNAINT